MQLEGIAGPIRASDGSTRSVRLASQSEVVVAQARGRYHEAVSRGNVWRACNGVAGVAPGTALATTAQALLIQNPIGSGVNLSLLEVSVGYVTGTIGAGCLVLAQYVEGVTNAVPGGTALVPTNCFLGSFNVGRARAFGAATCTAAPTIVYPLLDLDAKVETTASSSPKSKSLDGLFLVPPGTSAVFTAIAAAGTSPIIIVGAIWEEVPIGV